jgi:hypothetical protein
LLVRLLQIVAAGETHDYCLLLPHVVVVLLLSV